MTELAVPGFGQKIKSLFNGLTYEEIGELLGVGKSAVVNYVKHDRVPKLSILFKIIELRPCSLDWLLLDQQPHPEANIGSISLNESEWQEIKQRAQWHKQTLSQYLGNLVRSNLQEALTYPPPGEVFVDVPVYEAIDELPDERLGVAMKDWLKEIVRRASA